MTYVLNANGQIERTETLETTEIARWNTAGEHGIVGVVALRVGRGRAARYLVSRYWRGPECEMIPQHWNEFRTKAEAMQGFECLRDITERSANRAPAAGGSR